ncbi:MAG TPA: peptidoglycan-binding domain-containing protein [Actinotalea sp.]|nr:peptidoglycan-binding domain-containing protein [Actinotalea sp.]
MEAAQAEVTAAQAALAEADTEAVATAAAFCSTSSEYITALDRYGDVLNDTEPTVGDVTTAGADLTDPREETVEAAEAAVAAHDAALQAQQDLADAEAALAAAEAEAAGEPAAPTEATDTPSAEPLVPAATVERVQQAEAELATAQAGITEQTPLRQAAEQFNAAAVALQIAWMQLFAEAGCLSDEQQVQAAAAVTTYTLALQQALFDTGYYTGAVDGVYGPATVAAVEALQAANGLPQTGTVDRATEAALRAEVEALGGAAAQQSTASTAAVQQTLALAGYWDGPIDGQWTDALTEALMTFQTDLGVPPTGTVDAATIVAWEAALADVLDPPAPTEPSAEPSPSESTSG